MACNTFKWWWSYCGSTQKKENIVLIEIKPHVVGAVRQEWIICKHAGVTWHPGVQTFTCTSLSLARAEKEKPEHTHFYLTLCCFLSTDRAANHTQTSCSFHCFIPKHKEKSVFLHGGTNKVNHWEGESPSTTPECCKLDQAFINHALVSTCLRHFAPLQEQRNIPKIPKKVTLKSFKTNGMHPRDGINAGTSHTRSSNSQLSQRNNSPVWKLCFSSTFRFKN